MDGTGVPVVKKETLGRQHLFVGSGVVGMCPSKRSMFLSVPNPCQINSFRGGRHLARMALGPRTVQNIPDCFRREPMTDLCVFTQTTWATYFTRKLQDACATASKIDRDCLQSRGRGR